MSNAIRRFSTGYIESIKDKLVYISDYLYNNPELPLKEEKAFTLLTNIIKEEGFTISQDENIKPYSFIARYGSSSPNIAYILEYSASDNGHISGHNIGCGLNLGAALGLKRAIDQIGGTVTILGCSGDETYDTKVTMLDSGVLSGIDAVICAHPLDKTCESGSSLGMKEMNITFKSNATNSYFNLKDSINAMTPFIKLFNFIDDIKKNHCRSCFVNAVITKGTQNINLHPDEISCKIAVKSIDMNVIENIFEMIKEYLPSVASENRCSVIYNSSDIEYLPFNTNEGMSRNICHNLKESGIINVHGKAIMPFSLDFGNISHSIPSVQPYVEICQNNINYYTKEFSECTNSEFAKDMMIKAACALSLTGIDIIQCPSIVNEKYECI